MADRANAPDDAQKFDDLDESDNSDASDDSRKLLEPLVRARPSSKKSS